MRGYSAAVLLAGLCMACDAPAEPDRPAVETAYLLERVDGMALPARVCEEDAVVQRLVYESIALRDDDTYGRLQQTRIDDGPVLQQEELGSFARTDSTIVLVNAEDDTLTLALLDHTGEAVRRIHPCGDTLRYERVPVN